MIERFSMSKVRWGRGTGLCLALAACGGDEVTGTDAGDSGGADAGRNGAADAADGTSGDAGSTSAPYTYSACASDERVGGFNILADEGGGYSSVAGQVLDGIVPANVADPVTTSGDCVLLRGRQLFCDPACSPQETCDVDGSCIPYPRPHDVGTVHVKGLLDEVDIEPIAPAFAYSNRGTLTHPAFEEGAPIELSAEGGEYDPFSLAAEGVAPLDLGDITVMLEDGSPVELAWTAPEKPGQAHVLVTLNISLHGGNPVRIECEAEDTGALTIPADLVSELLSYGYSGFPAIEIVRQTASSKQLSIGCIDLRVGSTRTRVPVEIEGATSCNDDDDCADGETCQDDALCG